MKSKICFSLMPGYVSGERFKELKKVGNYILIGNQSQWFFEIDKIKKVQEIIGKNVEFDSKDMDKAKIYAPPVAEDVHVEGWKGESGFEVHEFPVLYRLIEWRKDKSTGEVKRMGHKVPRALVEVAWQCISKYPKGTTVKMRDLARNFCIARHDTDYIINNRFDFQKFFGSRGKGYFRLYWPIKIIEQKGLIIYDETGITRLGDSL